METMSKNNLAVILAAGLAVSGCGMTNKSMVMEATGAREGELPRFERHDYQTAQSTFRSKLAAFRSSGEMPADTTGFVVCDIAEETVQDISGYTRTVRALQNINGDQKTPGSGSLAAEVAGDAGSAGSAYNATQTFHWQGGAVSAPAGMCAAVASDHLAAGLKYLVSSQYVTTTTVNTSVTTHTATAQVFVDNLGSDTRTSTTISSMKMGGAMASGLMARAVISINDLDEPAFSYAYFHDGDSLFTMEAASARGIYHTRAATALDDGKVRTEAYVGRELAMINRSRNGQPHGLQEFVKYSLPATCYDNGEKVQSASCERF